MLGIGTYPTLDAAKADRDLLLNVLGVDGTCRNQFRCLFHDDNRPSLSVWESSGIFFWKCFAGCGHGTVVDALMLKEGIGVAEAIRRICPNGKSSGGQKLPIVRKPRPEPIAPNIDLPRALAILKAVNAELIDNVARFAEAKRLEGRGIPLRAAQHWWLGYAHDLKYADVFGRHLALTWAYVIPVWGTNGDLRAMKVHRDIRLLNQPKCEWLTLGLPVPDLSGGLPTPAKHGFATLWPPPEWLGKPDLPQTIADWPTEWIDEFERRRTAMSSELDDCFRDDFAEWQARKKFAAGQPLLDAKALLYLLPGELKALAVLAGGLQATSPTWGENAGLTLGLVARLRGRRVVLVYDDDQAGRRFRDDTTRALCGSVAELKTITFGSL